MLVDVSPPVFPPASAQTELTLSTLEVFRHGLFVCRMSGDEVNPAAEPQPVEDVQGDGRWISQVLSCASF